MNGIRASLQEPPLIDKAIYLLFKAFKMSFENCLQELLFLVTVLDIVVLTF